MGRRRGLFDCPSGPLIGAGDWGWKSLWAFGALAISTRAGASVSLSLLYTRLGWIAFPISSFRKFFEICNTKQTPSLCNSTSLSFETSSLPRPNYFPPFHFYPSFPSPAPPFFFPPPNISKCPAFSANALSVFPVNPAVYFYPSHTASLAPLLFP